MFGSMNRSLVKEMIFLPTYYELDDYAVGMPIEATADLSEVDKLIELVKYYLLEIRSMTFVHLNGR